MAALSGNTGVLTILSTNPFPLHPVDLLILGVFLVITLIVGLNYGKQVKEIKDYALGDKNFTMLTLVGTIVATFASGSGFLINIENTYTNGLYFLIPLSGMLLQLWLSGHLAARMEEFMDYVSIAEAMGSMYGRTVQIITACSSIIARMGFIAIQFKIIARVIVLLFDLQEELATALAASIIIMYSTFGGIKAVTFTDVLQFFTFGVALPIIGITIWIRLDTPPSQIIATLSQHPKFDLRQVISYKPELLSALGLFLYATIPHFQPELFQRIAMAKNTTQAQRALNYSAIVYFLIQMTIAWISILILIDMPGLAKEEIFPYLIDRYTYPGIMGLLGTGIIAMSMSTADSSLNVISVMFANDVVRPLTKQKETSITTAKAFSVVSGLFALLLALYNQDLLNLVLLSVSLYMPVFSMPMLMAVLGFRTSKRAILFSMIAGILTVIIWSIFLENKDSVVPGTAVNLLVLLGTHYLLGKPGGWQKIDPNSLLGRRRIARKEAWKKRKQAAKNFRLYPYLQQLLPPTEGIYSLLGFYAMFATYIGLYTIERADIAAYEGIYTGIYQTVLWAITAFITYPVWPTKSKRFMTFFWPLGMAAILLFTGMLLVILSHFHPLQLFVLLANFLLVALLIRWPAAIVLAVISISLAGLFFEHYTGESLRWEEMGSLQLRFLYGAFIFTGLLLAFFAYQEAFKRLGKKNEALQHREKDQQERLVQLSAEKQSALTAFHHTGAEKLLAITRALQRLPIAEEGKEEMKALQKELLPIAFHLQGIGTRSQDYLRLQVAKLTLKAWCNDIKEAVIKQGVTTSLYCNHSTKLQEINCDPARLTELLVSSIVALSAQAEAQELEEKPAIFFKLEDTHLSYPLPDVKPGYVKHVPAVRLAITLFDYMSPVKDSYRPNLNGFKHSGPEALEGLANNRIIKSHYGYSEVTEDTLIYVVPVDIEEVRPKDMDKAYMEVGAKPIRADDHFKNNEGIDAQAQEAAFLADVAKKSHADLRLVQMALETIKWYHGPSKRHSGEPFYLHPLSVAQIVLGYNTDEATIIGSLLHDTVEDTPMQLAHIEAMFGKETAEVVDVVTHLQSIEGSIYKVKMSASENLQMLDRTDSTQGLYVKLADRMHNMRTIGGHKNLAKRQLIAQETADFFIPLAEKLGLKETAAEFEKMCLEVFEQQA